MKTKVLTNIAIRVDASTRMGIGHVMRCLTLAKKLQLQNAQVVFLCKRHQGNLISFISQHGFTVLPLSAPSENIEQQKDDKKWLGCTYQQDAQEVTQVLTHSPWLDWLIVDHYSLDGRWQKLVKPLTNKIMVIDDLANREHYCDLLLDQTLNRKKQDYQNLVPKHCQLLLGANFMLLRDEFSQHRPLAKTKRKNIKTVKNLLISIGGTDPDNITEQIINSLITLKNRQPDIAIQVVASPMSVHLKQLKTIVHKYKWIEIIVSPKSMAKLILDADIAIGASGATAWERCCLGLPTLTFVSAKNQETIAKNIAQAGASINLGYYQQMSPESLIKALQKLQNKKEYLTMAKQNFKCCDGLGANRVVKAICKLLDDAVFLFPVTISDASLIFKWQSNPEVRKFLRNNKPVQWEEHINWLTNTLANPDIHLFFIKYNESEVGTLRLDKINKKQWEISIMIDPLQQGKKFALKAIQAIPTKFKNKEIIAEVHIENIASHKLFKAAGFTQLSPTLYCLKDE